MVKKQAIQIDEVRLFESEKELLAAYPKVKELEAFANYIGAKIPFDAHRGQKFTWISAILEHQRQFGRTQKVLYSESAGKTIYYGDKILQVNFVNVENISSEQNIKLEGTWLFSNKPATLNIDWDMRVLELLDPVQFVDEIDGIKVGDRFWNCNRMRVETLINIQKVNIDNYWAILQIDEEKVRVEVTLLNNKNYYESYTNQSILPIEKEIGEYDGFNLSVKIQSRDRYAYLKSDWGLDIEIHQSFSTNNSNQGWSEPTMKLSDNYLFFKKAEALNDMMPKAIHILKDPNSFFDGIVDKELMSAKM